MIALSGPDGTLWVHGARRGPDGLWRAVDPGDVLGFYPLDGTRGYLAVKRDAPEGPAHSVVGLDPSGARWEQPLPEPARRAEELRTAPDGELRFRSWRISPDGEIRPNPLGEIPGALPGPEGSWILPDGVQVVRAGPRSVREIRWIPREQAFRIRPLWVREVMIGQANMPLRLVRVACPGARPEDLSPPIVQYGVAPDGRWIALELGGRILLGDPDGVRHALKPDRPIHLSRFFPLHEGFLVVGWEGEAWWVHEAGRVEALPCLGQKWTDWGGWRIWPGARDIPAAAIFRPGSPMYWVPRLRVYPPGPGFPEWAQSSQGELWHFPPSGEAPRQVPLPPGLAGKGVQVTLVGRAGGRAILFVQVARGHLAERRLVALAPDGSGTSWPVSGPPLHILDLEDGSFAVFREGQVGRLADGWALWEAGPEADSFPSLLSTLFPQQVPGGWVAGWRGEVFVFPAGRPEIRRLRRL